MSHPVSLTPEPKTPRRALFGWMMFDWAAQPFFTVILTFIFAPYFVARIAQDPVTGQTAWANTIAIGGFIVAVFSPILGSISDLAGPRKPWLLGFAVLKILALTSLWWAMPGSDLWLPMAAIVVAMVAAEFSIVFNDSLMPSLMDKDALGKFSNYAWGLGYLGGLVTLFIVLLLLAEDANTGKTLLGMPSLLGLSTPLGEDARITGPFAALWYLVFLLPLFLFTPDTTRVGKGLQLRESLRRLTATLKELFHHKGLRRFLVARMLYQDGVNGLLALGGAFAAVMFGWQTIEVGVYGILLLLVAIAGCWIAGRLDQRLGAKTLVLLSLLGLIIATLGIVSTGPGYTLFGAVALSPMETGGLFGSLAEKIYVGFGLLIGLTFGPVQASSRAYMAASISPEEAGRYFGLYALSGRATAFLAPLAVAWVTALTESTRLGMSALILFLLAGFFLLWFTPYPANRR
ncbi:MAG: MFS transporter [Cellvibrio sp.]